MVSSSDVTVPLGIERYFASVSEFDPEGDIYVTRLQRANAKALARFGMRPQQVGFLPKDWRDWPGVERIIEDLRSQLSQSKDWLRDLRSSSGGCEILAPLYAEALKREGIFDPTFVICFHNPLERLPGSKDDAREHNDEQVVGLRTKYLLNALANTKGLYRKVVPFQTYLAELAGVPAAAQAPEQPDFSGWPPILEQIYKLCLEASQDESGLNEGKFDSRIEALCNEVRVLDDMTNAVDLPDDKLTISWDGGKFETPLNPKIGWQTFRAMIDAPYGAKLQFDPYQTPCYFWIRRMSWIRLGGKTEAHLKAGPNGFLEEVDGLQRLAIFGPSAATMQSQGLAELELEFLVQANDVVLKDLILLLKSRVDAKDGRR